MHDFFILAGTAAATLVGLLFVGLSLHLRIVIAAIVLLLLISLRNTWDLLVTVGEPTMGSEEGQ